jgi:hypothetical protein
MSELSEVSMMNDQVDYEIVRQRVDRKLKHERIFMAHMVLFLVYLAILTTSAIPISGVVLIGWSILLALHQSLVQSVGKREEAIKREIQREKQFLKDEIEKPKRSDMHFGLSDDGELVEITDDDYDDPFEEKPKRA